MAGESQGLNVNPTTQNLEYKNFVIWHSGNFDINNIQAKILRENDENIDFTDNLPYLKHFQSYNENNTTTIPGYKLQPDNTQDKWFHHLFLKHGNNTKKYFCDLLIPFENNLAYDLYLRRCYENNDYGFTGIHTSRTLPIIKQGDNFLINNDKIKTTSTFTIDLSSSEYDEDTFYPIVFQISYYVRTIIEVHSIIGSSGIPSWATHDNGFCCRIEYEVNANGWGTIGEARTIYCSEYDWCDRNPIGRIGQLIHSSSEYVFLRGGGIYTMSLSEPGLDVSIVKEEQTFEDETIKPLGLNEISENIIDEYNPNGTILSRNLYAKKNINK